MTSEEIRALRKRLGRSQEEMARLLYTTATTVGRWERGESTPLPIYRARIERLKAYTDQRGAEDAAEK